MSRSANRATAALLFSILGVLGSLPATAALGHDLEPVSPSSSMSVRKESSPDAAVEGPAPPLATLINVHTGESSPLDDEGPSLERFSALLEDRVTGSRQPLAPELLELLRTLARRNPGSRIELVSGFRSAKLNEMLRKKGHNVASHSQHSLGHAVDFRIVGLSPKALHDEIEALGWKGGIGEYDKPSDLFVHADVGRKRQWRER